MNFSKLVWLALLALWLEGCAAMPPAKPPTAVLPADELLVRLKAREERITSFQGKGRITFLSPQRNYSGTALLKGIEPSTLRVDVLDFLGRSLLSFSSNGQVVQVLSPKEGKFYYGKATAANMGALIPPSVSLTQVLRLLVGALPLSQGAPDGFQYESNKDIYLLEWHQPDGSLKERLWVKGLDLYPAKEEWYGQGGQLLFSADLAEYGTLASDTPGQIILRTTKPFEAELRLTYRELQLNRPLPAADLELKAPPAMAVVPLGP